MFNSFYELTLAMYVKAILAMINDFAWQNTDDNAASVLDNPGHMSEKMITRQLLHTHMVFLTQDNLGKFHSDELSNVLDVLHRRGEIGRVTINHGTDSETECFYLTNVELDKYLEDRKF